MKRSEINRIIKEGIELLTANNISLPEFAYWTWDQWKEHKDEIYNIKKVMLGWDVFDYDLGDFEGCGGVLFTLRNGHPKDDTVGTPYCEKVIIMRHERGQYLLMHFHRVKTEDIINRCGGVMTIQLYNATEDDRLDLESPVNVHIDGIMHTFPAGSIIEIPKGSSITLTPNLFHKFGAKQGSGDIVIGEVSSVNDDTTDNVFLEPTTRFIPIEEDEEIIFPLCNEYYRLFEE